LNKFKFKAKGGKQMAKNKNDFFETQTKNLEESLMTPEEGQLALDVFQTENDIIIKAPIAGVDEKDINVSITDEVVTIQGERKEESTVEKENYFSQEIYWGGFSRSYILPVAVNADEAEASLKDGVLTIRIPKAEKAKTKILKVKKS